VSADLVYVLRERAATNGDGTALIFLDHDDAELTLTYRDLDQAARAIGTVLADSGVGRGDRALLMYPPGPDYVAAFLGCLYAGVIAVPVYPPDQTHGASTVMGILADSEAAVVMVSEALSRGLSADQLPWLGSASLLRTGDITATLVAGGTCDFEPPRRPSIAFLQYTSGSTSAPKGVMVSHDNLTHNAAKVTRALNLTEDTRSVSWLPPYHDMGLIGGILQPIYTGSPAVLMPPASFLRRPARWLQAISDHGATASVAPAFGYAECTRRVTDAELAELDLSRWQIAMVGSETVRPAVLDAFADRFGPAGFGKGSFYPCYGLAEATLFVTGGWLPDITTAGPGDHLPPSTVGCGRVQGPDEVLIVDPDSKLPCPGETVGEVWITGPTVAQGYWRQGEDEHSFQAHLATGDERAFLRTGDLGYLRGDELFLAGRAKEVLIVRGRNHYPQDIEAVAESAHPSLRARRGAVFAIPGELSDRIIVVHELTSGAAAPHAEVVAAVRAAVVRAHGIDLDDVVLVRRGAIPRTTSGKTRRLAARQRYAEDGFGEVLAASPQEPPGSPQEDPGLPGANRASEAGQQAADPVLVAAAARVLGRTPSELDVRRSLVAQGLDSVRAAELRFVLTDEAGLDIALPELLGDASIGELLALAEGRATPRGDVIVAVEPGGDAVVAPACNGQVRLWLVDQCGDGEMQRIGAGVRLFGILDRSALRAALGELVRRHESLRTTLDMDEDGVVWQTVHPWQQPDLPVIDLPGPDRDRQDAIIACYWDVLATPFDLKSGPPLRAALVVLGPDEFVLLLTVHHVAADGWAFGVLWRELALLYAALSAGAVPSLPEPPQYRQVAAEADAERARERVEFWRAQLAGSSAPGYPADRPRPARRSFNAESVPFTLPASLRTGLSDLAVAANTTLFTVLLAGFAAMLARVTGQLDIVVGTDASNRDWPGGDAVVGFFTQVLAVRADVTGSPTFRELVLRIRERCLALLAYQDTPTDEVLRAIGQAGIDAPAEMFRVKFGLRDIRHADWGVPGLAVRPFEIPRRQMPHELSLDLHRTGDGELSGVLSFATDLFSHAAAERAIAGYLQLLGHAVADPECAADALDVMGAGERELIVQFSGDLAGRPAGKSVAQLLDATADSQPGAIAIADGPLRMTYAELHQRASQLAGHLRELGVGEDSVVGVYLPHSSDAIVSMLAVLKAAAVYLPLDTAYPAEYLSFVVGDARPDIVVTRQDVLAPRADLLQALSSGGATVVRMDADAAAIARHQGSGPFEQARPDALAYVIYTSGSTGVPKGAANTYGGLSAHLRWLSSAYPLNSPARVLQHTALGFDVSVSEILRPLATGACLVIPPASAVKDPAQWRRLVHEEGITDMLFVPSLLRVFLEQPDCGPCALDHVYCLGEVLPPELVVLTRRAFPGVTVHNHYGPAETLIEMTAGVVSADLDPESRVPIGRPMPGVRVYLLDHRFQPVPVGAVGEICIAGPCVGRGYLHKPGLTAERFVADPFQRGGRMYRSGDLASWLPDGRLDFAGRADQQVKLHGQRVEPAQIEAMLNTHPTVQRAVVCAKERASGDRILVAYLIASTELPSASELRTFLRQRLPEYLVPQAFVQVPVFPLNSSGKTDYRALPMPAAEDFGRRPQYQAPATLAERTLAKIWSEALNVPDIGRDDDFRELGGHSLMAIRIAARIRPAFGVEICVGDLLDGPRTLADLAEELRRRQLESVGNDELRGILRELGAI
jgi:amino acid adenylation domain-containing protein